MEGGFINNLSETGDEQWKFAENTKLFSANRKVLQGFKINEHKCKVMYMRKKSHILLIQLSICWAQN